ncbi:sulfite exporter TauE/SafE family protein [Planctomycetes bacterium K23_9]|uniref:Probable membrane transporter protein n=1 Tax=Stieleria marina TaxID=1930275 RepID=A0A517NN37_9BACT|nr:Sulfite exporter TauE/SafE [Planctomycetes bacterium K23_9]
MLIVFLWGGYLTYSDSWGLFAEYWPMSVTMLFGSFIAGATPQGGAAVAFPVFTKVFHMPATDARTVGLMLQSVGMTMAALTIWLRGIKILPRVLAYSCVGGVLGMTLGTFVFVAPNPYPKVLFTLMLAVFGVAMVISRWGVHWKPIDQISIWNTRRRLLLLSVGVVGGFFTAYTGAGADAITFIVLTLYFGLDEKTSTPTTILIMAFNSLVGFFFHGVILQDIGVAKDYWIVCIPIIIFGAPLGAWVLFQINRDTLIIAVLCLIIAEVTSTLILVPFTSQMVTVMVAAIVVTTLCFWAMLHCRQSRLDENRSPIGR